MSRLQQTAGKRAARSVTAALVMLMLINAVNYADRSIIAVLQVPIRHDLGLTDFQMGLLIGPAFALFYAVMGIPVARLAERLNRARIIIVAVTIWSLFTAACGLANGFTQLWVWRMGVGAAEAGAPPASHALIADYYPREKRGRAMAAMTVGLPIGVFYGSLLGGAIASTFGWHWAFIAAGAPGIVLAGLCALLLFDPRGDAKKEAGPKVQIASALSLLKSPAMQLLILIALLSGFVGNALPNFVVPFFVRAHGLTIAQGGALAAAGLGLAGFLGTLASGYLADRLDRGVGKSYYQVPAFACFAACLLSVGAFWITNTPLSIAVYLASSFFGIMIVSPTFAAVQNVIDPRNRATAAALFLFSITVAGAAGPAIVGLLSDLFGAAHAGLSPAAYQAACPGGRAAGLVLSQASCREAGADGLRLALMAPCAIYVILIPIYLFAAHVAQPELLMRRSAGEALV